MVQDPDQSWLQQLYEGRGDRTRFAVTAYTAVASNREESSWTRHCQPYSRNGPGVDQLLALPDGLEAEAIGAGWKFRDGWVCPECLDCGSPS